MPAGKRPESNSTLYTLITFVGLFVITIAACVILYVKFEEQRKIANESKARLDEMVNTTEQQKTIGKIIGNLPKDKNGKTKSGLGAMVEYMDSVVRLVLGDPVEDTSAEVKADTTNRKAKEAVAALLEQYPDLESADPNAAGLVQLLQNVKNKMDNTKDEIASLQKELDDLNKRFKDAEAVSSDKVQKLTEEKDKYGQQVEEIKKSYDELRALVEQTSEQRVGTLMTQLDAEKTNSRELKQKLLKTESERKMAEDVMKHAQEELHKLLPPPDVNVAAFKPDGKVLMVNDNAKTVTLNIGSDDNVYPGLTFSVYDRGAPIPKQGIGKAEVEVFDVEKNVSQARVTKANPKNPILTDDIVANLIWDSSKANVFVIAGDFDINSDGTLDSDAADKIKALIEKQHGKVAGSVSIDTDYVVLGSEPEVMKKPTFEELEVYPDAMQKYEVSLQKLNRYREIRNQATLLSIPIFNYERFLYFIGYKTRSSQAGAF